MRKRQAMSATKIAAVSFGLILAGTVHAQLLPGPAPQRPVVPAGVHPAAAAAARAQLQQYMQTGVPTPGTIVTPLAPPRVVAVQQMPTQPMAAQQIAAQQMAAQQQAIMANPTPGHANGIVYQNQMPPGGYAPVRQVAGQAPVGMSGYEQTFSAMESKAANDARVAQLVALAVKYEQASQHPAAVECYHRALELDSTDFHTLMSFARLKHRIGDLEGAIFTYQSVLKLHPNSAMAQNDLGLCQIRSGEFENAAELLRAAVNNKPSSKRYRNNLATVMIELGDTEAAIAAITPTSGEAIARLFVAHLLRGKGENDGATEQLTEALRLDPSLVEARQMLAELQMPARQLAEQMMHVPGKVAIPERTANAPQAGTIRLQSAEAPVGRPVENGRVQRIGGTDESRAIDDSMSAVFRADHYEIIESLDKKSPRQNAPKAPAILQHK